MGLSVQGGTFNSPTSTGNVTYSGVCAGNTPKLVILYTTLATGTGAMSPYWGAATGSSARWSASTNAIKGASANSCRIFDSTKVLRLTTELVADFLTADFVSFGVDSFTLNWTKIQASGFPVNFVCLEGTDLNAQVGFYDTGIVAGSNVSVTGVGFQPKAVLMTSVDVPSLDGTGFATGNLSIGAATSSSARSCVVTGEDTVAASPTNSYGSFSTSLVWELLTSSSTAFGLADFVSNDADGFTVRATASASLRIGYVALGGAAQYFTSTFAQPGSTGNQAITGVGFTPSVDLFWSAGTATINAGEDNARIMFGASISSSDRGVTWASQKDNSSAPAESRATLRTKSIDIVDDNSTTILADADFVSQDADGFTNNWTTADATARVIGFLSIGAAGGVAPTPFTWLGQTLVSGRGVDAMIPSGTTGTSTGS